MFGGIFVRKFQKHLRLISYFFKSIDSTNIYIYIAYTGTSKKNKNMVKKVSIFSCNLFQKVKLFYILDSLHVK